MSGGVADCGTVNRGGVKVAGARVAVLCSNSLVIIIVVIILW